MLMPKFSRSTSSSICGAFLKWVCLKMGYIPNYSHLIGIMIINHWVYGYTIFRHTQMLIFHVGRVDGFAKFSHGGFPGPLAKTLDMRDFVDSFDITGRLEAGQILP